MTLAGQAIRNGEAIITQNATLTVAGQVSDDGNEPLLAVGAEVMAVGADGSFEAVVELREGFNRVIVVASDVAGHTTIQSFEVLLDSTAPELVVDVPQSGVVNTTEIAVAGSVEDATAVTVTVEGAPVEVEDGAFAATLTLPEGRRTVTVAAADAAGNVATVTLDIDVFVSDPFTLASDGGARAAFPAGALTRQDQTVELIDLSHPDIQQSLGDEGDEIVAAVPSGGLTEHEIVIPGAVAVRFEGESLPDPMVNMMPAVSVPAGGGLTNEMPLWILQLVPDTDGDGLPELKLVSEARISDDGTRLNPVPPPPGSPLPGPQFTSEFGFTEETIDQVAGLTQSSTTYVFCCCGVIVLPAHGETRCEPSRTPDELLDQARYLMETKRQLEDGPGGTDDLWRQVNNLDPEFHLRELVVNGGLLALSLTPFRHAATAFSVVTDVAKGRDTAFTALRAFGVRSANGYGDKARFGFEAGLALEQFVAQIREANLLFEEMDAIHAMMDDIQRHIDRKFQQAHELSGCSEALVSGAALARDAGSWLQRARSHVAPFTEAATALDVEWALLRQKLEELDEHLADFAPLAERFDSDTLTESDLPALRAHGDRAAFLAGQALDLVARVIRRGEELTNLLPPALTETRRAIDEIGGVLDLLEKIPLQQVPKSGVMVRVELAGAHHTTTSRDGRFVSYVHARARRNANGTITIPPGSVSVQTIASPFLSGSASVGYPEMLFVQAGLDGPVVDMGKVPVSVGPSRQGDTDGDGIEDAAEELGGLDMTKRDTDGDGIDDRTEIFAGSDPKDPDSVPGDDRDRDALADGDETALGTDPMRIDTDRDGLIDGVEVHVYGTDPLLVDTDGDGFTDRAELIFRSDPTDRASTPGADTDGDGIPDDSEPIYGTDPANPDTDSDGLSDGFEAFVSRTHPNRADTDGDGIVDGEEVAPGDDGFVTDPEHRDTDRDRFLDGFEVAEGSDPTDPTSIPGGDDLVDVVVRALDGGGNPIPGAEVRIHEPEGPDCPPFPAGDPICEGTTNDHGEFAGCKLAAGTVIDVYAVEGCRRVTVADEGGGEMSVVMTPGQGRG